MYLDHLVIPGKKKVRGETISKEHLKNLPIVKAENNLFVQKATFNTKK